MDITTIVVVLIAAGIILWAINRFITLPRSLKIILNVAVILVVALWLSRVLGILISLSSLTGGR